MTLYLKPFDLVIVPFPYSDDPKLFKPRPGLVVSSNAHLSSGKVFVAMITSVRNQMVGDIELKNWQELSLPVPSKVRASKIATFEISNILKRLARCDQIAIDATQIVLRDLFEI